MRRSVSEETTQVLEARVLPQPRERKPYLLALAGREIGTCWELGPTMTLGRGHDVDIPLFGHSVSRRHAAITIAHDGATILDLDSKNGTFVNGDRVSRASLRQGDRVQLGSSAVLRFSYQDALETDFHTRLAESAFRDSLTGLHNRRFLVDRFPAEIAYARRHSTPLSLVMFDIDHFKRVNDVHGHPGGDAVLSAVADMARRAVRAEDILVRYGGEEFLVLCRATARVGAVRLADRLRTGVQDLAIEHDGRVVRVTISVGVSVCGGDDGWDATALLAMADRAMYAAKRAGRNRVEVP